MAQPAPAIQDLVLVGGGHSHVEVLREFGRNPLPGIRLTLICHNVHTPYSGMLPGLIAGHYQFEETHIDLRPLARFGNARFIHNSVVGLDLQNKHVLCESQTPVPYDLLSINIGSTPATRQVSGAAENTVPVKPISRFFAHWETMRTRLLERDSPARIAVVGAGAGGVELLLSMQYRLQADLSAQGRDANHLSFHLVTSSGGILETHGHRVGRTFDNELTSRGIQIHTNHEVVEVRNGALECANGAVLSFDEILWVTTAGAAAWPASVGLDTDEAGFITVSDTLQSTSHPDIFAAGDIATMVDHPRPKSGAVAVRQGPPLAENLRRHSQNMPLRRYTPQRDYLALISTGNRYAIASRGRWTMKGKSMWWLKDWIDRRFMNKYSDLPKTERID